MKPLTTLVGVLSTAFSALVVRPVNSYQGFIFKSTATANTPVLVLLGLLATGLGVKRRSIFATLSGMLSAGIGLTYIRRATAPHGEFERAFGPDWKQRIPPATERRMLRNRLTWRLPHVPEPIWTRNIPFWTIPETNRQLFADIWQPPASVEPSGIAIVYLYGGSWHFFDKDVLTRPFFRQLAAQGHLVMDVGHRSCPEVDVTGMVNDVHYAIAWIKSNAEKYDVDPEKVVIMGGSSGAHIALLAAYAPDHPQLKPGVLQGVDTSVLAVVSYYGIPDMYSSRERWMAQEGTPPKQLSNEIARRNPGKVDNFLNNHMMGRTFTAEQLPPAPPVPQLLQNLLGGQPDDVPEMYKLASPISHVTSSCPPTLMFQGTHDAVVPLDAARALHRVLVENAVPVVYVEYPWAEHAFDLMYPPMANPAAKAALHDLERFLASVTPVNRGGPDRRSKEANVEITVR